MIRPEDTTDLPSPPLPRENDLSRRYLRMIEKWIPVGVEYFTKWPNRPNCGHFFGGCHWYGNDTNAPAKAFALASLSPEYNEKATGVSREQLREMAIQGVRYLCFTHDSGPEDCVRPAVGLGRPENCNTKWGERGKGFFRESQCGHGIAAMSLICLLLRDHIDEETWMMMARVQEDYAGRFGDMPPKSGVYWDTQMEENAWTAHGLTSCFLFLSRHEKAAAWEAMARRWMYSTCATPQDAYDFAPIGDSTARALTARTYTTLPDYWAENHGMVHPGYTTSGVRSLLSCGCLLKLWGRDLPPELFWNRKRVYEGLKAVTDGAGYAQAMQGMDWHYLPTVASETPHAIASVFFDDPDAAALQLRALRNGELRQEGNGGAMYDREFAQKAHDQQDPMIMRETTILGTASLYLFHRLMGPGAKPTPEKTLEKRLAGVRHYPHAGFVHHRHPKGQTSLAWRNSIMAMPLTREGIYTIAPCTDSYLGRPRVQGRPDSHRLQSIRVSEYDDGFAAAMVMDRCQESLRQQVLFASLPDGRVLSFERFVALEDVTVEGLDQGFLRVTNEHFPLLGDNCRGARVLHRPDGSVAYKGWLGDAESDDVIDTLDHPAWLNIDDRLGLRFSGTGVTIYHNRHYFKPYRAISDDLTLSSQGGAKAVKAGQEVGHLGALICPEQKHRATTSATLLTPKGPAEGVCLVTDGFLAAAHFGEARRSCAFELPRPEEIPVYPGATVEAKKNRLRITVVLEGRSAVLLQASRTLTVKGDIRVETTPDGAAFVTNPGKGRLSVKIASGKGKGGTRQVGAGQSRSL
ncbi:MAG: hypothetical protein EXS64_07615 [Candidatus Latescibacteria bacterium]|nr:hypothetical protein [Candidatus Latescibacterota bacterium]